MNRCRVIWTPAILLIAGIASRAEPNAKPMFSSSEIAALDQMLISPKVGSDRAIGTRALIDVFSTKAVANLEDQIAKDLSSKVKGPGALDRTSQDRRVKESLGEERLNRIRHFFQENIESTDLRMKKSAIWWFLMIDPDPAGKSRVEAQLASKDANVQFEAARQLAVLRNDSAGEPILITELSSRQISRALMSADALAKLKNEKARQKAFEIYSSTVADAMSRGIAIDILAEFKSAEVDGILVGALDDSSPRVVSSALGRLQARSYPLNRHAIDRLFQIIDDKTVDGSTKMMAVWALQYGKKARSQEELRQEFAGRLKSGDLEIAAVAVTGLMVFGDKKDVKQLVPLLDHPSDPLKAHVERTLGKISGVHFDKNERDVKVIVAKRKEWWAQHSNDSEYR